MKDKRRTLNVSDWVKAGFRALTAHGPQGIRVEAIARELKVSKGSFYWHFRDVAELRAKMLEEWAALGTLAVIRAVEEKGLLPREQLFFLIALSIEQGRQDYGGMLAEAAIRDWARHDPEAARVLKKVEGKRLEFVRSLFEEHGFSPQESRSRANILYAGLIGLEHLAHWHRADIERDLFALLDMLLDHGEDGASSGAGREFLSARKS